MSIVTDADRERAAAHELRIGRRRLGAAPLAHINGAAGVRYGTDASCSCGGWKAYTNEVPPSRGGRTWARVAHARHVEDTDR